MASEATIVELRDYIEQMWEQKDLIESMEKQVAEQKKIFNRLQLSVKEILETNDLDNFKVPGIGLVYVQTNLSYKVPQGDDKKVFFQHLRAKGIFEDMVSVNSKTLNSWAKQEFENAVKEGDLGFSIPGLQEPTASTRLGMRKDRAKKA